MAYITWTKDMSVGVDEFDREHRKLFDMINKLHDALKQGKGKEAVAPLLNGLAEYTVTHFFHEEQELRKVNYPEFQLHKTQHEDLLQKVRDFQKQHADGKATLSITLMDFLRTWLSQHIMVTDKKYAPYFSKVAVK
jgi:hemerythrin-like metal-binding protein